MEINPKYKNKAWNPQDFLTERSAQGQDPVIANAMSTAVDEMRAQQQAKLEQERLLGEYLDAPTAEEVALTKKQMIERLRGF